MGYPWTVQFRQLATKRLLPALLVANRLHERDRFGNRGW
jgi:hypothetical protein